MKLALRYLVLTVLFALGLPLVSFAESALPVLVGTKGKISGVTGPAPQPLSSSASIETPEGGAAMLAPVPGQSLFIDSGTRLKIKGCEIQREGDQIAKRSFACQLVKGHVHSSILAPKSGVSEHEVETSHGVYMAKGTSWSTWAGADGDQLVVFAGVVTANVGGQSIGVAAGQVLTSVGSGDSAQVVVIDLRTGRRLVYTKGSADPSSELATAEDLKKARDLMESALGVFEGTASANDKIGFAMVLEEINKVLVANLLPALPLTTEWHLFPNQVNKGITTQETLASPEKPLN